MKDIVKELLNTYLNLNNDGVNEVIAIEIMGLNIVEMRYACNYEGDEIQSLYENPIDRTIDDIMLFWNSNDNAVKHYTPDYILSRHREDWGRIQNENKKIYFIFQIQVHFHI